MVGTKPAFKWALVFHLQVAILGLCHALPMAGLPPLLRFEDGSPVRTTNEWLERRKELKQLLADHLLGSLPTERPTLASASLINTTISDSVNKSFYLLTYKVIPSGRGAGALLSFPLQIYAPHTTTAAVAKHTQPSKSDEEARPIFMTQWNHWPWALRAVSRGYVGCVYPAADTRDATPPFAAAFPNATWGLIARRAWLASLVVDFIHTLPFVDKRFISISGHSRNGKQSLIAAAFDERITAVVGSSSGAPIASPFRFTSRQFNGESVLSAAPVHWWLNTTVEYYGRENELAADGHMVLALIAPRSAMMATGWSDHASDIPFANEQNYVAVREVYRLWGVPERLRVKYRPADHHGYVSVSQYIDFFERAFNRSNRFEEEFQEDLLHQFNWSQWNSSQDRQPISPTAPAAERIQWLLGEELPSAFATGVTYSEEEFVYISDLFHHDVNRTKGGYRVRRQAFSMGDYVTGDIYYPLRENSSAPLPSVIWLHPLAYHTGFAVCGYGYGGSHTGSVYHYLASRGFIVVAYDQLGFGLRLQEGTHFYDRYPRASRFGAMVRDASSAVDALMCLSKEGRASPACGTGGTPTPTYPDHLDSAPLVDPERIFMLGYSVGGAVALHAAARDTRVAGVATFSGFTPYRSDVGDVSTGGTRRWYQWHALLPRLGWFAGPDQAADIPYDFDDVLSLVAPRPTLIYAPLHDRASNWAAVNKTVGKVRHLWPASSGKSKLSFQAPSSVNQFLDQEIEAAYDWLTSVSIQ